MPQTVTLNDIDDIRRGVRALRRQCHILRHIHDLTGDPPLRRQAAGFEGLAAIIISQQISAASADAIWRRTRHTLGTVSAARVCGADDAALRACGLSGPKMRALRAVASAIAARQIDLDRLGTAPEDDIHAALTGLHGIGPWTADIDIMFSLGRADAWAAGDLALQRAIARAFQLPGRPSAAETIAIAEAWRPWRAVAARLMWSFHAQCDAGLAKAPTRPKKSAVGAT